ncbi:mastermind-like protein 1 isoform X2 [Colossoma macropomum]|uniref:mastermind-like protein 1 isoform X2 n=1 Tax=Colossoma macropomum TaxID=42526 RepID=UPI001865617E|nr:mastermind-like protein 1 isoform X2 [Colossoma macropomum]
MADFVVPRHSAVMERLRRRIELFRRHHNSCENRYEGTAVERMELERQQTFALHQRCLQTKAKRSNKHRQQGPAAAASEQAGQRAPGTVGTNTELPEGGGAPGEQSRNSTLIALQETVKRKLENAGSPMDRDQVNGFSDGYPPSKKSCLEDALGGLNGASNGTVPPLSPLDTKHGVVTDSLVLNGTHATGSTEQNGVGLTDGCGVRGTESDIRLKEMKQEPMEDILPTGGGNGNIILPDLNLNEQEWTELMEEFNRSVPYEEIQELFNDGFEDRKDPDLSSGGAPPNLLPPDHATTVKTEFSPAPASSSSAFEQDSRTGSPHVPPSSSGPLLHTGSPVTAPSAASSPALPGPQHSQQQQQQPGQPSRPLQNHLLSGPSKDLSPAQQLQQLAAREQQRAQLMQSQHQSQKQQQQKQQQQQQQQAHKFHQQPNHTSTWPQNTPNQSPLGGPFGLEKPTSPSLYPPDFQNSKSLLMPGQQPNKGSPKAGAPGGYMQPGAHPMLGHPAAPSGTLSHPPSAGGQAMLDYRNTKPLSHFEASAPGPPRAPAASQVQNKAALLNIIRQQQQQQQQPMKQRPTSMPFRPHLPLTQEPGTFPSGPHVPGPGGTMATQPGGSGMPTNHSNVSYLSGLQKQQQQQMQMISQQKFLLGQQRQLLAEQEKQRQQEQQLQRHLTRPPPQYQDQQNPSAQQNPFQQQQQVSQFPGSSQPMGNVNSLGGAAPSAQRLFSQAQGIIGMGQGGGPAPGAPPTASQADMSLPSCAGGLDVQQVLYGNISMHPSHPNQQRLPVSAITAAYRQSALAQQHSHLKSQPNAALLKQQQQQLARLPNSMPNTLANNMNSAMSGSMSSSIPGAMPPQAQSWQQQQQQQPHPALQQGMAGQPNPSNSGMPSGFPSSGFHMQPRMPKLPNSAQFTQAGMGNGAASRAMTGINPGQMMPNMTQQRTNNAGMGQQLPPPNQQQQQPQQGQQAPPQSQQVLPDLGAFGQPQGTQVPNRTAGMPCNQAYQVNQSAGQQLQFGYSSQPGGSLPSFPGENDLVDWKNQSTQEWMDDLDALLANHQ